MSLEGTSNATYIRDECIRIISPRNGEEDALVVSITDVGPHNDQLSFVTQGKLLMGEIEEITILDQNMNAVAVHKNTSHTRYSMQSMIGRKREELLKKRITLQNRHDGQSEALLKRHEEERHQVENHPNFGDDEMEYILANVIEPVHQKQLGMMKERHQKEQQELMDLMFQSAFGVEVGNIQPLSGGERKSLKQTHNNKTPPDHL